MKNKKKTIFLRRLKHIIFELFIKIGHYQIIELEKIFRSVYSDVQKPQKMMGKHVIYMFLVFMYIM